MKLHHSSGLLFSFVCNLETNYHKNYRINVSCGFHVGIYCCRGSFTSLCVAFVLYIDLYLLHNDVLFFSNWNRPEKFNGLLQRLKFLEAHKLGSPILNSANQIWVRLAANIRGVLDFVYQLNKRQLMGMLIDIGSNKLVSGWNFEAVQSSCWVPFDIYMENVMDVKQLPVKSAIVILRGECSYKAHA